MCEELYTKEAFYKEAQIKVFDLSCNSLEQMLHTPVCWLLTHCLQTSYSGWLFSHFWRLVLSLGMTATICVLRAVLEADTISLLSAAPHTW